MLIDEKILPLSFHDKSETIPISIFVPFAFCFIFQFPTLPRTIVPHLPHMLYICSTLSPPTQEMLEYRRCILPFDCICINPDLLELDKCVELKIIVCYEYYIQNFHRYSSNLRCKNSILDVLIFLKI